MKPSHSPCTHCSFRGYSKEICKLHSRKVMNGHPCGVQECSWKSLGKKAVIGAGLGVTGIFAGLAVLPAFGLKAILGHSLAVTMSSAGGALGAGTNVVIHRRKKCQPVGKKRKRSVLLPNYWRKSDE